jgi:hypothetical protein
MDLAEGHAVASTELVGKISEYFQHGKHATEAGSGVAGAMFAHADVQTPLTDAMEHPDGGPTNFVQDGKMTFQDALHEHGAGERIAIHAPTADAHGHIRHDSFIRSLKDYIGSSHHEIDHPGQAAETIFHDAAKEYANSHNISYEQAVSKLSKIHPGTTYTITQDSYGIHMHIDDGDVKFFEKAGAAAHHATAGMPSTPNFELNGNTIADGLNHAIDNRVSPEIPSSGDVPWNNEVLENQTGEVAQLKEQYGKVLNSMTYDGVLQQDYVDERMLRTALEGAKKSLAEITENPNGSYGRTLRNVLKAFSDKNISEWNRIEKLEAAKMLIPEGSPELGSLSQEARAAMKAYGDLVPPKKGEIVGRWVVRFMQAAKDGTIKK